MSLADEIHSRIDLQQHIDSGNDGAIVEYFNASNIPALGEITAHKIKQYLSIRRLRVPIMDSQLPACKAVTVALSDFPVFDCSDPLIYATLDAVLTELANEAMFPEFTVTDKATILSFANTNISLAEKLGLIVDRYSVSTALRNDDGSLK